MTIALHLAAIVFGAIAYLSGPDDPAKMYGFAALAAATFVFALTLAPASENYGVECQRYSAWATNC